MGSGGKLSMFWCDSCQGLVAYSDWETAETICEHCVRQAAVAQARAEGEAAGRAAERAAVVAYLRAEARWLDPHHSGVYEGREGDADYVCGLAEWVRDGNHVGAPFAGLSRFEAAGSLTASRAEAAEALAAEVAQARAEGEAAGRAAERALGDHDARNVLWLSGRSIKHTNITSPAGRRALERFNSLPRPGWSETPQRIEALVAVVRESHEIHSEWHGRLVSRDEAEAYVRGEHVAALGTTQ